MRMRLTGLIAAALVLASAAPAFAGVIVDQLNDDRSKFEQGFGTQRFEPAYAAEYDWAGIDDFTLTEATTLSRITVQFWGFNGFSTTDNILSYGLEFYSDPAHADVNLVGDVASLTLTSDQVDVSALLPLSGNLEGLSAFKVSGAFNLTLNAGTYWLALIPRMDVETGGQTSTMAWSDGTGGQVYHVNPGHSEGVMYSWPGFNLNLRLEGSPASAPEPQQWVLMLAGFGLAGAALRRRRAFA